MRHAASRYAVPPKHMSEHVTDEQMAHIGDVHRADVTDSNMNKDTHQMGDVSDIVSDAQMVHICSTCHSMYDSGSKHDMSCKNNWSPCIVMSGTLLTHDVRILFDPGAESNIISEAYVKRYAIPTHESKDACNGVMADGTVKPLLRMVMNLPIEI
jgi:hypothetical protein